MSAPVRIAPTPPPAWQQALPVYTVTAHHYRPPVRGCNDYGYEDELTPAHVDVCLSSTYADREAVLRVPLDALDAPELQLGAVWRLVPAS